ncbi:hypothetical protein TorRG33x02_212750, partial [Trema orientale]
MLKQMVRIHNNTEYRITVKLARGVITILKVKNLGDIDIENLGDIEPGAYKDVPYSKIIISMETNVTIFEVAGVSLIEVKDYLIEDSKEIKLNIDDNGKIIVKIIGGNCFDRMR